MKLYVCPECNEVLEPGVLKANSYCHACAVRQDTSDLIVLGDDDEDKEKSVSPDQENERSSQSVAMGGTSVSSENGAKGRATQAKRWKDALQEIAIIPEAHWKPIPSQRLPYIDANAKLLVIDSNTSVFFFWFLVLFLMIPILGIITFILFICFKVFFDVSEDFYSVIMFILSILYLLTAFKFHKNNCVTTHIYISYNMLYIDNGLIKRGRVKRVARNSYTSVLYKTVTALNNQKYIVYLDNGMNSVEIGSTWNEQTAIRMTEMMQRMMNFRWIQPSFEKGEETDEKNHCDRCEPALQRKFEGDIGCDCFEGQGRDGGGLQASREKGQSMSGV